MIYLGLGANMGDKVANLRRAVALMQEAHIHVFNCSSLYNTPPWGHYEQDDFVNAVCEVDYNGSAEELLSILQGIEEEVGRVRRDKWGPREIDLDILEFKRERHHGEHLCIPHPYYVQRTFVLVPFVELNPTWVPTGMRETVSQLLDRLPSSQITRLQSFLEA